MKKIINYSLLFLCGFLFSCKIEIKDLSYEQNSYDYCSIDLDYTKNGNEISPISETVTVKVPSERYISDKNSREKILLPDKIIGSNIPVIVKVCGLFKGNKSVCDSITLRSSVKSLDASQSIDFSNFDKPIIKIEADLYRNKFKSESEELIQSDVKANGIMNFSIADVEGSVNLPVSTGYYYFDYAKAGLTKFRTDLKKIYSSNAGLYAYYDIELNWKNRKFDFEYTSQNIEPQVIKMEHNYYHENTLGGYNAAFYKYYNYGNNLGVVTFKEYLSTSGLEVEVYSDYNFTNLIQKSSNSNVLFKEYSDEFVYIKIINTNSAVSKYRINTHSVNHHAISQQAAERRLGYGLISLITGDDPNDVARFFEITSAIVNGDSFDKAANDFLYNEFKRQMSNVAGGNFLTDLGADALSDIAKEIYKFRK